MPPIAQEIDPHPKSLNNITLSNLLQATTSSSTTTEKFLTSSLSGITSAVAARITAALGISQKPARTLQAAQVAALIQALRDEKQIKPPSATCLSPAGEYNMRLGVLKELKPKMVATFSDKSGSHEGHPFLVEASISLGGTQVREGINVYRFANRIPLLFEAGADVVTQVATKRINWSSYHIDPKKDNIGVYVSIGMLVFASDFFGDILTRRLCTAVVNVPYQCPPRFPSRARRRSTWART
jgi:DNA topoisomerase-6 subunit B